MNSQQANQEERNDIHHEVVKDFNEIIEELADDDYERGATKALAFLKKFRHEAVARELYPYAEYFKLFAEAYRKWQTSYNYQYIKSCFRLAYDRMAERIVSDLPDGIRSKHSKLVMAFGQLSEMLCEYTCCENSFILNDPFALVYHSQNAIEIEEKALKLLGEINYGDEIDNFIRPIHSWLSDYFEKNLLLHRGLNSCALIYVEIFNHKRCSAELYKHEIQRAREALEQLQEISMELSSELRAHIIHVEKHQGRFSDGDIPTFLTVRHSSAVLSMSAACDRHVAAEIIENWDSFKAALEKKFNSEEKKLSLGTFRHAQLQDIFETSFGEAYLKNLEFDLPPVAMSFLDRTYIFNTNVVLSSFGVCTLFFTFDIQDPTGGFDEENLQQLMPSNFGPLVDSDTRGLFVEEIRALLSCICPHSGQVKINFERAGFSKKNFLNRLNLHGLFNYLVKLEEWYRKSILPPSPGKDVGAQLNKLAKCTKDLRETINEIIEYLVYKDQGKGLDYAKDAGDEAKLVDTLVDLVKTLEKQIDQLQKTMPHHVKELSDFHNGLKEHCDQYTYLADVAEEFLSLIGEVFCETAVMSTALSWHLRRDTGWYVYVYALGIDVISAEGEILQIGVGFDEIADHPDALGLAIEQREARASFDDWRFMRIEMPENLAYIRSHGTDAFFGSEFQAFLFFPDDPQFLTDQYLETVKLMIRIDTLMKHYHYQTEILSKTIMSIMEWDDSSANNKIIKGKCIEVQNKKIKSRRNEKKRLSKLNDKIKEIKQIHSEATMLRNLISKAGVSRYKDHGELMEKIIQKMKLDKEMQLLENHLTFLDSLHENIISEISEKLKRRFAIGATILGAFVGVSAIKDVHDMIIADVPSKWNALYAMAIFFSLAIIFELRNKSK